MRARAFIEGAPEWVGRDAESLASRWLQHTGIHHDGSPEWDGSGRCALCEIQFIRSDDYGDLAQFHLHSRCFAAWEIERGRPRGATADQGA